MKIIMAERLVFKNAVAGVGRKVIKKIMRLKTEIKTNEARNAKPSDFLLKFFADKI